jgi:hypothetical protein
MTTQPGKSLRGVTDKHASSGPARVRDQPGCEGQADMAAPRTRGELMIINRAAQWPHLPSCGHCAVICAGFSHCAAAAPLLPRPLTRTGAAIGSAVACHRHRIGTLTRVLPPAADQASSVASLIASAVGTLPRRPGSPASRASTSRQSAHPARWPLTALRSAGPMAPRR